MANYTDSLGFYKGTAAYGAHADKRLGWLEVELDFAKIVAARSAASATALAAADTLQVLQIKAGTLLLAGGIEVVSAETTNTTATFDLGCTGGSPLAANGLANDFASNALATTTTGLAAPVFFSAADTLDLLLNTAVPANAKVRVWALVVDCN